MTREQIEQMPAGRELDALIATRVLGWQLVSRKGAFEWQDAQGNRMRRRNYSTDIAAAKQVQAKLFADGYDVQIWQSHNPSVNNKTFLAQASKNAYYSLDAPEPIWVDGSTEELALAHLALLTILSQES